MANRKIRRNGKHFIMKSWQRFIGKSGAISMRDVEVCNWNVEDTSLVYLYVIRILQGNTQRRSHVEQLFATTKLSCIAHCEKACMAAHPSKMVHDMQMYETVQAALRTPRPCRDTA
jgi:hypothetical protein